MSPIVSAAPMGALPWRTMLSGMAAVLVGIGLSRFAYTPIVPVLIAEGWFSEADAGYLGAANLLGYFLGAATAARMGRHIGTVRALHACLLLATAAFFACAFPLSFLWYFLWRLLSGATGGMIMVLGLSLALTEVPAGRRGLVGGVVISGVGLGVLAASFVVPLLLEQGLRLTWLALGGLSLAATAAGWSGWRKAAGSVIAPSIAPAEVPRHDRLALGVLGLVYAMTAMGLVPHMVFYADYLARGLGRGIEAGAFYWGLFGLGAIAGPPLAGRLADLLGFRRALNLTIAAEVAGVGLLLLSESSPALAVSALVIGGLVPGMVPVVAGRAHELAGHDRHRQRLFLSRVTAAFAVGQAAAGYLFSALFALTGDHLLLFTVASGLLLAALVIDIAGGLAGDRRRLTSREEPSGRRTSDSAA